MEKEKLKHLLHCAGYKPSTIRAFLNGGRQLFTERQQDFIVKMLEANAPTGLIVNPSIINTDNSKTEGEASAE